MADDEFAAPDEARKPVDQDGEERDRIDWKDKSMVGALVLIQPYKFEEKVDGLYGPKDAVRADVSVIDGKYAGRFYEDQLIFGVRMVDQLKTRIDQKVLARFQHVKVGGGFMHQLDGAITEADKDAARKFKRPDEFSSPAVTDDDTPPF